MAVILGNARLGVARKDHAPVLRDAWGVPVNRAEERARSALLAASLRERPDTSAPQGREWSIRLDPSLWPVEVGDHVVEDGPREWVVTSAQLATNVVDAALDHVAVVAVLEVPEVPA